jgi:hypothetical protein
VNAVRRATVTIAVARPDGEGGGSGFVITSDGVIATAAHVIRGAITATVRLAQGETFDVQGVIALDEARDFALLRIASFGLPTVVLGNSDSVEAAQRLLAFGAPLGLDATVSDGLLSSVRLDRGTRLFQVSIPVSPGSSGGPVATEDGRVIGLVVSGIQGGGAQNLNFALPINYLRGQIALASAKVPIPLAQVTYGPAAAAAGAERGLREAAGGDAPNRVNDSLGTDWRILDGVQIRSEEKRDQGIRLAQLTEYALARTPTGEPALERMSTFVVRQTENIWSGRDAVTWYQDNTRDVLGLDTARRMEHYWRRTPIGSQVAPGAMTVEIDGGKVVVDSGGSRRMGTVPQGTLPATLLGAVVAVLPDSLPRSVYIWFFNPSSSPIRAEPLRIDFGRTERIKIPVARAGTRCSLKTLEEDTEETTVDAVQMTATMGPERLSWPVLARRPHLRLEDAKCVRIPSSAQG